MKVNVSNKNWILLSTTILIGIAFSVYFLVYVKNKEKTIVSNNFRVLQQIVTNIKSLEKSYLKNAETTAKQLELQGELESQEVNSDLFPIENFPNDRYQKDTLSKIRYGIDGLIFQRSDTVGEKYWATTYEKFFDNELFHRNDIFDQIIISQIPGMINIDSSKVIYSNGYAGIVDTTFYKRIIQNAKSEVFISDNKYVSFNQLIDDDFDIYISGLIDAGNYNRQKRSVSPFMIFLLSVLLILVILSMPLLKLRIMSIHERLYLKDVSFSILSVLLGPAVFIVFIYASNFYFHVSENEAQKKLEHLNETLEQNFQNELSQIIDQIDSLNSYFEVIPASSTIKNKKLLIPGYDRLNAVFDSSSISDTLFTSNNIDNESDTANRLYDIKGYQVFADVVQNKDTIFFKHLKAAFWVSDSAQLMILLSAFHNPSYVQDLYHRKYLTKIIDDKPDLFKNVNGHVDSIAIESIKSVNDGSHEIGVGRSTGYDNLPVFAISTKMASVMDPVLEEGYGFCLLDKEGNTLFHSDISKNMNENFINETGEDFRYAMDSKTDLFKKMNYNGIDHMIFLRPMTCLSDYYIVTFVKNDTVFSFFTTAMISTFILYFGFLAVILLVYILLYLSVNKGSKLKQMAFMFNIFRPYETYRFYGVYKKLIRAFIVAIVYIFFTYILSSRNFDFTISELLMVSVLLVIGSFYLFINSLQEEELFQSHIKPLSPRIQKLLIWSIMVLLFVRYTMLITNQFSFSVLINSLLGLAVSWFVLKYLVIDEIGEKHFETEQSISPDQIQKVYKKYLFLWLIILSIIPIHLFLSITIENEQKISFKFRNHSLQKAMINWESKTRQEFREKFDSEQEYKVFISDMDTLKVNMDTLIINRLLSPTLSVDTTSSRYDSTARYRNPFFSSIYKTIRIGYNTRAEITTSYIKDSSIMNGWDFYEDEETLNVLFNSDFNPNTFLSISMDRKNLFSIWDWFMVLNTLFTVMILFYFLNYILNRIYGFHYKAFVGETNTVDAKSHVNAFLDQKLFKNDSSYNNIFFVSVNSANTSYINAQILEKKYKFFVLDFYDFNELQLGNSNRELESFEKLVNVGRFQKEWEKVEKYFSKKDEQVYIIIEHFEYAYNDIEMNKMKLEVLKYLTDCENFKVLVKSEFTPTKLLEFYESALKRLSNHLLKSDSSDKLEIQAKYDALKVDFKKWQHLLGSFTKYILPLSIYCDDDTMCTETTEITKKIEALKNEYSHGEYLNMVNKYLKKLPHLSLKHDDKTLFVQQMSYPYYFGVWNSLCKEERYIVYDIAKDRYVNTTNTNAILSLLSKGILVYDYSLRLMNDSFTNFVLTKVNSDEALEMELISRKKGTWNTAFAVILLLIVSLVIFLSIGQQNFLNDINAFLTSIAALIGLLIRFSGFVSFGSKVSGG